MKKYFFQIFIILTLAFLVLMSFTTLMPIVDPVKKQAEHKFSVRKALVHVENMAQNPHYVGSDDHSRVRNYIVDELQKLGLAVHTQNGYVINSYGVLTNPQNIVAVMEGTDPKPGNDLLVLSHYDSDPHSSFGASDDAAAVAAILESLRALKVKDFEPKNNIIVCITDAEEIGLLGAQLFAEQHPLVENVGLMINFEARGSGGPSNMIIETNQGNAELVETFVDANPQFPMASSLMYEVYKTMPNDTDATVFRVEKDIPGFFFAFIDRHYNYHTALDTPENLDHNSLAHQGSYLMRLLPSLGDRDFSNMKSHQNKVYFNFPFFKMISYSYGWIFPLLILGWLGFAFIVVWGIRRHRFHMGTVGRGALAFLIILLLNIGLGILGWKAVLKVYPQYLEIQQGFPYNGHIYIAAFVCLGMALSFWIYHRFWRETQNTGLMIAPLFLWLLINTFMAFSLKGASFFIIPVLFFEVMLVLKIWRTNLNPMILMVLVIPAIFILTPLIVYVPVALGLKMMFAGLLLLVMETCLLFIIFDKFKRKNGLALLLTLGGIYFLFQAHGASEFSKERPKPNSLVYQVDKDLQTAEWNTYDKMLDEWTETYFKKETEEVPQAFEASGKYGVSYTHAAEASYLDIPGIQYEIEKDSQASTDRYHIKISPQRNLDRINLYSDQIEDIHHFKANGIEVKNLLNPSSKIRKGSDAKNRRLLTYYMANQDTLYLDIDLPKDARSTIEVMAASHDLLNNEWIPVAKRPKNTMPKPFVLNDAIITKQRIALE